MLGFGYTILFRFDLFRKDANKMPKRSTCRSRKFAKVMREYHAGTLKSGGKTRVKSRKQAQSIAHSVATRHCGK